MKKFFIELSSSERLVLFEFLYEVLEVKYDKMAKDLFDNEGSETVLANIQCQLESELVEPFLSDYERIVDEARKDVENPDPNYDLKQYNIGKKYFNKKDYKKAFEWYQLAAENGNKEALFDYVLACWTGNHITRDHESAIHWLKKAGIFDVTKGYNKRNFGLTQYNIGLKYFYGDEDCKRNYEKAFEWYQLAAENRNAEAQYALALAYWNGNGIKQNNSMARYWLLKAVDSKHPLAIGLLASFYENGWCGFTENREKAIELYKTAINGGDNIAKYNLAVIYYEGNGIQPDKDKAVAMLSELADDGFEAARDYLKNLK